MADEIVKYIPRLSAKRGLDPAMLLAALQVMPIDWHAASEYEDYRKQAEARIASRDPDDLPTVALALKLELPVWTQDKDHLVAGVDVLTTGELLDALREAGHVEQRPGAFEPTANLEIVEGSTSLAGSPGAGSAVSQMFANPRVEALANARQQRLRNDHRVAHRLLLGRRPREYGSNDEGALGLSVGCLCAGD